MIDSVLSSVLLEFEQKKYNREIQERELKNKAYKDNPEFKVLKDQYNKERFNILKRNIAKDISIEESYELLKKLDSEFRAKSKIYMDKLDTAKVKYDCNKCNDRGFINGNYCSCFRQRLANKLYSINDSELDVPFLRDIKFDIYPEENLSSIKKTHKKLLSFVNNFNEKKGNNYILYGGVGLGKTYISRSLAKTLICEGNIVVYLKAPSLFKTLNTLRWNHNTNNSDIRYMLYESDLLIIDDLGKEIKSETNINELFEIINERYINNRSTIINTNMLLKELIHYYGDAIFSRLSERLTAFKFVGTDLRLTKGTK
ncbi:MAG: hypothetical protein CSB16_01465 [Clostridiales bacterium]|nr:MAG: hypothetical protein CSB16_01465 [Clostridiales bacterium]